MSFASKPAIGLPRSFRFPRRRLGIVLDCREKNFSVDLASVQANYSFSRFLTFSSVVQMDTANTQAVSGNFRLRYNYRPDSDLFIVYNVGTQFVSLAAANPQQIRETRFAVKIHLLFRP